MSLKEEGGGNGLYELWYDKILVEIEHRCARLKRYAEISFMATCGCRDADNWFQLETHEDLKN